jgi:hypothetical protein
MAAGGTVGTEFIMFKHAETSISSRMLLKRSTFRTNKQNYVAYTVSFTPFLEVGLGMDGE